MRIPVCVQDYVELLDNRARFVQANYGDGEWACILGHPGQNCNGEHYIEPLQLALIKTVLKPPAGHVWYGSNPGKKLGPSVEHWLLERGLTQRTWVYKEILSGANANGKLSGFIAAVRRRKTVLVGPKHLRNEDVHKIWNIRAQVSVPTSDAYLAHTRTVNQVTDMLEEHEPELMLVCAGMAANPLIHEIAAKNTALTIIDMGATLDPYAGVWSRNAYRKEEFQKSTFAKNLRGLDT
jgi:hypothetical protein